MSSTEKATRNQWIREQFANGKTMTQIASEVGVSVERIRQIVRHKKKVSQATAGSHTQVVDAERIIKASLAKEAVWLRKQIEQHQKAHRRRQELKKAT